MDLHRWRGLAAAMVSLGCVGSSPAWAGTLEGTPTYRERIALPAAQHLLEAGAPERRAGEGGRESVERYRLGGSHLEMLDATGAVRARLESVALR